MIYESGWIAYRVRGIGRKLINGKVERIIGGWSANPNGKVSAIPTKFLFDGHDENLNWDYNLVLAEEGKNKTVITYHDGTLRNRQLVSKINSIDKAIVGETVYDFEGREAIQVVPVPIESPKLNYKESFNTYGGQPISPEHFDVQGGACIPQSIDLDVTTGASKYYSQNNGSTSPFKDFVPDAEGHPYIQTQYTADQTGRVRKLSGIGATHALGTGHELTNYYETATDNRLQRLFGSEVGEKEHYSRNIVEMQMANT